MEVKWALIEPPRLEGVVKNDMIMIVRGKSMSWLLERRKVGRFGARWLGLGVTDGFFEVLGEMRGEGFPGGRFERRIG
jgi:hypothetical protein